MSCATGLFRPGYREHGSGSGLLFLLQPGAYRPQLSRQHLGLHSRRPSALDHIQPVAQAALFRASAAPPGALAAFAATPLSLRPRALIAAGVSVLLGAWTHIVWDSFTHNTWVVKRLPLLRESVFQVSNVEFPWYVLLQHLSTVVGATILIAAYCSWLRLHRETATDPSTGADDRWRYLLLVAVVAMALVIAVPRAVAVASRFAGYRALNVLVFRMVVDTTVAFSTLLTLSSLVLYATRQEGKAAS